MSSHSLIGANRNTHLKITAAALVGAILLVVVGMIARTDNSGTVTAQVHGPVLKVGKPMTLTIQDGSTIR
jgi:ABC-type Fe3+-siderophore transport system permease subunit